MRFSIPVALIVVSALVCNEVRAQSNEVGAQSSEVGYALGTGDQIRIRVNEWREASSQFHEWDSISGEYAVNPSGAVSIPLAGEVPAAGLTSEKLALVISQRLQAKIGVVPRPEVAVEIIKYRSIYILGAVNRPGDYSFRPGMTVLQAVGVAGGFFRPTEWRLEREAITAVGELRVAEIERSGLLARKARLEAEMKGDSSITFPADLTKQAGDAGIGQFLKQEQLIFQSRRNTLVSQTESLEQLKSLLENEVKSLQEKYQVQDRQLALAQKESGSVQSLVNKGLAVTARQLSSEQQVAQIESTRLDLATAMLRAQQERSKAERDILELRNTRQDAIATSLKEVEVKLQQVEKKVATNRSLIAETQSVIPTTRSQNEAVTFHLVRHGGAEAKEAQVSENTLLQPDDVLRVRLSPSESLQADSRERW
jgi:protein involved in polysaccharide export with SLBB domain